VDIPWKCADCNHETMVDLDHLKEWQVDKLTTAQGFTCEHCGKDQAIYAVSISLREAEKKLFRYPPSHPQFQFLFSKLLKKASGMLERVSL